MFDTLFTTAHTQNGGRGTGADITRRLKNQTIKNVNISVNTAAIWAYKFITRWCALLNLYALTGAVMRLYTSKKYNSMLKYNYQAILIWLRQCVELYLYVNVAQWVYMELMGISEDDLFQTKIPIQCKWAKSFVLSVMFYMS